MLKLEIVTPERRVIDSDADSVTVPTASGEAGILGKHAPLISALKPGVLSYSLKGQTEKLAVSTGFVEVHHDQVSVLTDVAELAEDVDMAAAKADRDAATRELAELGSAPAEETEDVRERLDLATARLAVVADRDR